MKIRVNIHNNQTAAVLPGIFGSAGKATTRIEITGLVRERMGDHFFIAVAKEEDLNCLSRWLKYKEIHVLDQSGRQYSWFVNKSSLSKRFKGNEHAECVRDYILNDTSTRPSNNDQYIKNFITNPKHVRYGFTDEEWNSVQNFTPSDHFAQLDTVDADTLAATIERIAPSITKEAAKDIIQAYRWTREDSSISKIGRCKWEDKERWGDVERVEVRHQLPRTVLIDDMGRGYILCTRTSQGDRQIGDGIVKKAKIAIGLHDGKEYAVLTPQSSEQPDDFVEDHDTLNGLQSVPNVARTLFYFRDHENGKTYQIMPRYQDFYSLIRNRDVDLRTQFDKLIDVCNGIVELHNRNFVHRDIKPGNLFYDDAGACIGDMGLLCSSQDKAALAKPLGTPSYYPPEVRARSPWSKQGDVWSFGAVIHQVFLENAWQPINERISKGGSVPFPDAVPEKLRLLCEDIGLIDAQKLYRDEILPLLQGMLHEDPTMRITSAQVLERLKGIRSLLF